MIIPNLKNKIAMVTGATDGIGYETVLALANYGAHTIVVGRNKEKSQRTVEMIEEKTGNKNVEYMLADLSSQEDIHKLANEFNNKHDRLDILVNNAGAFFAKRIETVDGIEMTFALNHLSYYLLTGLLLDKLKASENARIVNVSSNAHTKAKIDMSDIKLNGKYSGLNAYGVTKLYNIVFTFYLAEKIKETNITVNSAHPGVVATKIGTNNKGLVGIIAGIIFKLFGIKPELGAQNSIFLATSKEVEGVSGGYFVRMEKKEPSAESHNKELEKKLIEISAKLTGFEYF